MSGNLAGKNVAILATDGFEQVELAEPKKNLEKEGAVVKVLSLEATPKQIKGWDKTDWGEVVPVDATVTSVTPEQFDALVLPGGQINPDKLRMDPAAMKFVKDFLATGKPVAAICHGPWALVEVDAVRGKTVTSWPSIHTDLKNAGAKWVDQEVVVDGQIITSRKPGDIPAFCRKIVEALAA